MKTMLSSLLSVLLIALSSTGQARPAEWPDDLVAHMSGTWKLQGTVLGAAAHHIVIADWVLNHQFLRIHENTASSALLLPRAATRPFGSSLTTWLARVSPGRTH